MTPAELSRTVLRAVRRAVADDTLPGPVPDRVAVGPPRPGGRGDYASNVALRLAGPAGRPPREVAEILRTALLESAPAAGIDRVEITGPGFLNFTLAPAVRTGAHTGVVRAVRAEGARYGHGDALAGTTVALAPATEPRAALWTRTVIALLRTQGAAAATVPGATEALRPVPVAAGTTTEALYGTLGTDAAHWALLRPAAHDRPYTGPEAARALALLVQRESNGLFLVRYAHARTRALARAARHLGITPELPEPPAPGVPETAPDAADPLRAPEAAALVRLLGAYPDVLASAARLRAPDRLARHLEQTADAFLRFQESCRPLPLGDEKPSAAHRARLALADAAGTVLAGGLSLLGVDAPEHL
ncbi:ArgS-related anticodon-binding protein NrtL [Streptomyces sp. NPDC093085]|uniref:ArgS-related anticodon-binding protein NrtL n=1 Tax=Streptomyces sp. NPDC093085 TaxID=3155068 RepID=UPI0034164801